MKKQLFILVVLAITLFSCKNNNDVETIVTVKLNPSFISLSEGSNEPMKVNGIGQMKINSATVTDSVVYAIQVYENDAPSYYGLFNDISKMQLALITSKTYKFKVTAYRTGTGKGLKSVIDTVGTNYFLPNKIPLKNIFVKGDALKDIDLASSIVLNNATKTYAEADVFYTTKTLTLDKGTTSIDFTMLRMGFGINFTVDALTSGNMEIYIGNDTLKLNSSKTSAYTIRQFATTNTYTSIHTNAATFGDSIAITAKWTSTSGTVVTAAGKYKFLRNYQKAINIQLNALTNNVSFESWKIPTDGLVAWYPFNGNANDESGNGNNGTVYSASLTTDRFDKSNSCYDFNFIGAIWANRNKEIYIPYNSKLNVSQISVSTWIYPRSYYWTGNSGDPNSTIVRRFQYTYSNPQGGTWGVNFNATTISVFIMDVSANTQTVIYNTPLTLNSWSNISFTYNGSVLNLFLNGNLVASKNTTIVLNVSGNSGISIGDSNQANGYWDYTDGKIDDIGIWNRALSQSEITMLYNLK